MRNEITQHFKYNKLICSDGRRQSVGDARWTEKFKKCGHIMCIYSCALFIIRFIFRPLEQWHFVCSSQNKFIFGHFNKMQYTHSHSFCIFEYGISIESLSIFGTCNACLKIWCWKVNNRKTTFLRPNSKLSN